MKPLDEVQKYQVNREARQEFQEKLRELIETRPLYSSIDIEMPPSREYLKLDVARLECHKCKTSQPFRPVDKPEWAHCVLDRLGPKIQMAAEILTPWQTFIYPFELVCQECKSWTYTFFVQFNRLSNKAVKFGQIPMWLPPVDKELRSDMGADYGFYVKALRCMNESYGIGACAYFRRMVESYINPLLSMLLEYKRDLNAEEEELQEIEKVIKAKDFTSKIKYAGEICPENLIVQGVNPIKKMHELLSYNLHEGTDEEAMQVALQLKPLIEYVIPELRKQHERRKAFIESSKLVSKIDPQQEEN